MSNDDADFFWYVVWPVIIYMVILYPMMDPPKPPEDRPR